MASLDLSALDSAFTDSPAQTLTAPKAPLSKFEEDPENPRTEFDDVDFEKFVKDIEERGILQPISVIEVGDKYRIKFGARRFRAATRLNLSEIPYFIIEDVRQLDDYSQVSENEQRKNLQPLDMAMFINKKISEGAKKKEIADRLKIDPSAVTHYLSLLELPAFLMELYHSRKCRTPQYLYQLKTLHEKNSVLVETLLVDADVIDRQSIRAITDKLDEHEKPSSPLENSQVSDGNSDNLQTASEGSAATIIENSKPSKSKTVKADAENQNGDLVSELKLASSAIENVVKVSVDIQDHALYQDFDALMVEAKAAINKAMTVARKIKKS